jgi:hypothetical protein
MFHSTFTTTFKNVSKVTEAEGSASLKETRPTQVREEPMSDTEGLLVTWTEDQTPNCISLSTTRIGVKVKSLLAMLKKRRLICNDVEFTAGGRVQRFRTCYSLSYLMWVLMWRQVEKLLGRDKLQHRWNIPILEADSWKPRCAVGSTI